MDAVLLLQSRLCYATGLIALSLALFHGATWLQAGTAVEREKTVVLGLLATGALAVGWVVETTVADDLP